jgi:hypothetical protein
LRSDLYRTILAVLEMASEFPEISFVTLARRAGRGSCRHRPAVNL